MAKNEVRSTLLIRASARVCEYEWAAVCAHETEGEEASERLCMRVTELVCIYVCDYV
jgi:hypothetical protein